MSTKKVPIFEMADPFDTSLPLPYRLAMLVVTGTWLWGFALELVKPLGRLVGLPNLQHQSTYTFSSIISAPIIFSAVTWTIFANSENATPPILRYLPHLTLLLTLLAFVPIHIKGLSLPRNGRSKLASSLKRVSIGGLAASEDSKFGDVLLADALTSYARPVSQLYVALCMVLPKYSHLGEAVTIPGGTYLIPLLVAYPFLIRLRQCLISRPRQVANAIKYATAFPPIVVGALMSRGGVDPAGRSVLQHWW